MSTHPLQATVAILSTSPDNSHRIQDHDKAHLQFHVFDILRFRGADITNLPLIERQAFLWQAIEAAKNPHLKIVPTCVIGKTDVHRRFIEGGGEGTVWKRADQPYQPGKRVRHWLKKKRSLELEVFVSGFKPGTHKRGHSHLIGAVEFSTWHNGRINRVAWVCGWTDRERKAMTQHDANRSVQLNPSYLGRRALIAGQDYSAKSKRIRHARIVRWLDE